MRSLEDLATHMTIRNQPKANIFRSKRWEQDHSRHKPSKKRGKEPTQQNLDCKIAKTCGACRYINSDYKNSVTEKYQAGLELLKSEDLLQHAHLSEPIASPKTLAYRCHAKLAVRLNKAMRPGTEGQRFSIGMFQRESHKVIDISYCPLHKPSINRFIKDLKPALEDSGLEPYDEENHTGDLRYLAIRAAHLTDQIMVTFVCNNEEKKQELKTMLLKLRSQGHAISSAHLNLNSERTNRIFGSTSKRLLGADRLREQVCDLSFEIGPSSFFQVNPWLAELIYRRVEQLAAQDTGHSVAWDLYCGTGQISMLLANNGYRTIGVEENPQATRDAQKNVVRNQLENPPQFVAGRVESFTSSFPSWASQPNIIVVNPSRKGLSEDVREFLKSTMSQSNSRLIYVSCEISTLTRDLTDLCQIGKKVRQVEAFDMFPFTEKMEWLAVID